MNHPSSSYSEAHVSSWVRIVQRVPLPVLFSGATYFFHFLALGFASFPLQTHLRQVLGAPSASLVASVTPVAACLTYFLFRFAESRLWTRSPERMLAIAAISAACMQLLVGWRLREIGSNQAWLAPALDAGCCMLMLGLAHSSCMTLLNHIGVANLGSHAFTVRAAGSAGYMVAVILMGLLWREGNDASRSHLFIACSISLIHAGIAAAGYLMLRRNSAEGRNASAEEIKTDANPADSATAYDWSRAPKIKTRTMAIPVERASSRWAWWGLLTLVWMVAMCEMSYSLYAHEFLTGLYGQVGYFLFAGAIALEILLLLGMPWLPAFKERLLFVGPLGWLGLLTGCMLAVSGMLPMGVFALALSLNCPFQVSANEHAHRMNPSILGVAAMSLAQSLGYVTATLTSAVVSQTASGPRNLWFCMLPIAAISLVLALGKLWMGPESWRTKR